MQEKVLKAALAGLLARQKMTAIKVGMRIRSLIAVFLSLVG